MEAIFTVLFEIFGELILGALLELILGLIGQLFGDAFAGVFNILTGNGRAALTQPRKPLSGAARVLLFALASCAIGAISLQLFPASFARSFDTRVTLLIGVPIACGLMMAAIGAWRHKRGRPAGSLESFSHGLAFALPTTLIRFIWAT
jgi:hypothetical protein